MPYKDPEVAKQKSRERYYKNREARRAKSRTYYQSHKEQMRESNRNWVRTHREKWNSYYAEYQKRNKDKIRLKNQRWRERFRTECFAAYGNKCVCCGEIRQEFFAMDHINGGGGKHRRSEKYLHQGSGIHKWLKQRGYPKDFRILCHNCNMARGFFGYCPHERERVVAESSSVSTE